MQVEKLIRDASGMVDGSSVRAVSERLATMLNAAGEGDSITPGGVNKWVERGTVPGPWLMRIAKVAKQTIDIATYG